DGDALVVPLLETDRVPRTLRSLDAALDGLIGSYLGSGDLSGKAAEVTSVPTGGIAAGRVIFVGLGQDRKLDPEGLRRAGGRAVKALVRAKAKRVALLVPALRRVAAADVAQALCEGLVLGGYRFDKYKTLEEPTPEIEGCELIPADARQIAAIRRGARAGEVIADATNFARDLSNEPGSVHTPAWMAQQARKLGRELDLKVTVLAEAELRKQKMGAILAVGRGSAHGPRLIAVEYGSARSRRPTIALVGKGITFDTGGISIKPAASMSEMKHDMSGAAAVLGAMRAIAQLRLPLRVVGIVAAAQNMPDGEAYLPGDVVTSASGKTIEVLNTDAEGRVVLADALHYASRFSPKAVIDLATLTGACVVALGSACCGLMGNDEKLISKVREAGDRCHERAWPLPLWDEHKKQVKGVVGDVKNTAGRQAGPSTAGAFLSHFVDDTPWVHLDIAGTAWTTKDEPYCVRGATGFGVRLLTELLQSWR
ncbi:MAG: leucyl aminopeptidase, partial [Myxococcota bacterium]